MTDLTNKHSQGIQPIDEEAIKATLGGSDHAVLLSAEEADRNIQLTHLYPQETELKGDFHHAPALQDITPLHQAVEPMAIAWSRVAMLGLILALPFVMLESMFSIFMRPPSDESLAIVATAAFYCLFAFSMLLVLRRYLLQELEKMNLTESNQLFWSSVLLALPITQVLRLPISMQFEAGPISSYLNLAIYLMLFVVVCVSTLLSVVYVRYRSAGSERTRVAKTATLVVAPYVVGLLFFAIEIARSV